MNTHNYRPCTISLSKWQINVPKVCQTARIVHVPVSNGHLRMWLTWHACTMSCNQNSLSVSPDFLLLYKYNVFHSHAMSIIDIPNCSVLKAPHFTYLELAMRIGNSISLLSVTVLVHRLNLSGYTYHITFCCDVYWHIFLYLTYILIFMYHKLVMYIHVPWQCLVLYMKI